MIIEDEGLRLLPYRCTAGKLTIGVGRNLDDVGISKEEALFLFRHDITRAIQDLWLDVDCYRILSDTRKAVLLNLRFNLGRPRFLGFKKMLTALNEGDYEETASQILDSKAARDLPGRYNRLAEMMRRG